jgi:hypothetical protein
MRAEGRGKKSYWLNLSQAVARIAIACDRIGTGCAIASKVPPVVYLPGVRLKI